MKSKVIKFKNGSSVETLSTEHSTVRSDIKYLFPKARGNGKPALSMIQFLEMYRGTKLTDDEKMEIWNLFYEGDRTEIS